MLFSATMPPEIRQLAKKHMHDPEYIQVEKTQGPAESVKQISDSYDGSCKTSDAYSISGNVSSLFSGSFLPDKTQGK